jgi:hypothetical protein
MNRLRQCTHCRGTIVTALVSIALLEPATSPATISTYTTRTAWIAALPVPANVLVDFNGYTVDTSFASAPLDVGPFTIAVSTPGIAKQLIDVPPFLSPGDANIDGTAYAFIFVDDRENLNATMTFDEDILAFAGDFRYAGNSGNQLLLELTTTSGVVSVAVPSPSSLEFVGFTSTEPVSMIRLRNSINDGFGLDNIEVLNDFEQRVTIDIKPGSDSNSINCKGNPGVIPVAVLTTDTFDALTIDHTTVRFGPGEAAEFHVRKGPNPNGNGKLSVKSPSGVPKRHEEDVDHDGDLDLVFHFARAETGIVCGDTEAVLTGQTFDGQSIFGSDTIRTVPDGGVEPEPDGKLRISPNPFNPATSIAFAVSEPQHVTVRVYDVRGRLVAELADGSYPAGQHQLEWRGRDTSGRVVSSGTYFFRIDRGGQVEIRKALLLK